MKIADYWAYHSNETALVPIHITEAWFESYKVATVAGDARRFHLKKRRGGRLKVEQCCLLLKEWQVEM